MINAILNTTVLIKEASLRRHCRLYVHLSYPRDSTTGNTLVSFTHTARHGPPTINTITIPQTPHLSLHQAKLLTEVLVLSLIEIATMRDELRILRSPSLAGAEKKMRDRLMDIPYYEREEFINDLGMGIYQEMLAFEATIDNLGPMGFDLKRQIRLVLGGYEFVRDTYDWGKGSRHKAAPWNGHYSARAQPVRDNFDAFV